MPTSLLADVGVTITELKRSPTAALDAASGRPVAILNHNVPTHYAVPARLWEQIVDALDDLHLREVAEARMNEGRVPVTLDELMAMPTDPDDA